MIAITFAIPEESKDFVAKLQNRRKLNANDRLSAVEGNLGGNPVVVVHTGIGPLSTEMRLSQFLGRRRIEFLIAAGFAGGLNRQLESGDIVVAENFSNSPLLKRMQQLKLSRIRCFFGELNSQPRVIETAEEKRWFASQTNALAVDMETQTIHELCIRAHIPILAVRAISDDALRQLPVPMRTWFDAVKQKPRVLSLLGYLVTHPAKIPDFVRFAGDVSKARRNLTEYLVKLIRAL